MTRPRAADDFAAIRARMEELRRERAQASKTETQEAEDRGPDARGLFRRLEGPDRRADATDRGDNSAGGAQTPNVKRLPILAVTTRSGIRCFTAVTNLAPLQCIGMTTSGDSRSSSVTV